MAVLAMLTRQLGIVLFAAYFIASIVDFLQNQNKKEIYSSVVMCASGVLILYGFEKYMSYRLTPDSSYQGIFVSPKEIPLGADAVSRIFEKTAMILRNSGSAFVILFVLFLPGLVSRIKAVHYIRWMLLFSVCAIVFFSMPHVEVIGDVLINFGLGLESTVDIAYLAENTQTNMHPFYDLLQGLLVAGALLFLLFISSFSNSKITTIKPTTVFLFALCFFYLVSIGVAESSYDRYCLFFMLFAFITVAENMIKWTSYSRVMSAVLLLGMSVFSVLATRDYFDTAKLKMNIRKELLSDVNIAEKDINTGFDHELWDGTVHEFNWINWDHYMDKRFVLARGSMDGFMVQKTYMYSKYLPPFSSTFYVLESTATLQSH